jgi:hypothetical protein
MVAHDLEDWNVWHGPQMEFIDDKQTFYNFPAAKWMKLRRVNF